MNGLPVATVRHGADYERAAGGIMQNAPRNVSIRVLGQDTRLPCPHIHGHQRRLVAATGIEEIERLAVLPNIEQPRAVAVTDRDGEKRRPGTALPPLEPFKAAVLAVSARQPQSKGAVGEEPSELRVFEQQFRTAAHDVDAVEVKEAFIPLVMRQQHLPRKAMAHLLYVCPH